MTSHRGSNAYETKSRPKKEGAAPLDGAPRYRLVRSVNSITLMCPNEGEEQEAPVSLSYLLAFPHLTEPVAQAVLEICKSKASAYATCERMGRELKTGFLAFLKEKSLNNIKLEQLTTSHIEGFKTWLDRADKTGIALYALQTREHRMSYLRQVMHYLKQSDKWATLNRPGFRGGRLM